ncbi:unnamed protein product [Bursaphelenchus okinawaensis]|uniref:EGF-like domain-containing protein n=1 Tax=Bursaphelenchus okinawaensis TaxID=465554 RepID=A0A811JV31_9BILA|nr:unnamed protein product [Bursaphelenchus okinawaensis]CAG9083775.1 unnamed protein product [Bursaphelenchus okinawaensis]
MAQDVSGSIPQAPPPLPDPLRPGQQPEELPENLGKVAQKILSKLTNMMGFGRNCLNNGNKRNDGSCECRQYFSGERCEIRQCLNNGTLDSNQDPEMSLCICPNTQYITGDHCEIISCQNGGRDMGNGTCKCIDDWYSGQFCEFYSSSWLAVLGIPMICLVIIIGCCVFCRADFFSKPHHDTERRRRNRRQSVSRRPTPQPTNPVVDTRPRVQQQHHHREYDIPPPPTYMEPSNISDLFKTFEPPPSYDLAMECRVISSSNLSNQAPSPVLNSSVSNVVNSNIAPPPIPDIPNPIALNTLNDLRTNNQGTP